MPSLGFLKRFEQDIVAGFKRQTCRAPRRIPIKVGDALHLFVGLRTRACRKLATVRCIAVDSVRVTRNTLRVGGLKRYDLDSFARCDGFDDWHAFVECVERLHGLPFDGSVITWSRPGLKPIEWPQQATTSITPSRRSPDF